MDLLAANATGAATGDWTNYRGGPAAFVVGGTHGGATFSLQWRPTNQTDVVHPVASYTAVDTDALQQINLPSGQVRAVVTGGTGVNAMPRIVF